MILLLACATTPTPVDAPAATPVVTPDEPSARRYTAAEIAAVAEKLEAVAADGSPVRAFARDSDIDGAFQPITDPDDLPDSLTPPGATHPVESTEYFALFTLPSGESLVMTGTRAQGDGLLESSYLFSPAGELLRFTYTEGGSGDICGDHISHLTVLYPADAPAERAYAYTINNGEPIPEEYGCQEAIEFARSATDPGWEPSWRLLDELPVDTSAD
jgi:hypothetical protein